MKRFIKWKSMIRRLLYRNALDRLRNDGLKKTTKIKHKKILIIIVSKKVDQSLEDIWKNEEDIINMLIRAQIKSRMLLEYAKQKKKE